MPKALLALGAAVLVWSGIAPRDRFTWLLEVFPAILGGIALAATYGRFRFTNLVYSLMAAHALILMVGGKYTYAEVPAFNWLRDAYGLSRNHYDRVGHFAQGFVPAMIARELLLRKTPLRPGGWLYMLVVCCCLAVSAAYELVEWWTALATREAAAAFLGTQGDPWDTQWDMFMALIGANAALLTLSAVHTRQLHQMGIRFTASENARSGSSPSA
jgi:putative membrane protein